jgi:flagellar biosynthesis/type III secretory pathway protein FliH
VDKFKYIAIARNIAALNPNNDQEARAQQLMALFEEAYEEGYNAGYEDCSADIGLHVQ